MSTIPGPDAPRIKTTILLLWIIWASTLGFLGIVYLALGSKAPATAGNPLVNLIGFVPLFISVVIRWLMLPRSGAQPGALLVLVIVGVALAGVLSTRALAHVGRGAGALVGLSSVVLGVALVVVAGPAGSTA